MEIPSIKVPIIDRTTPTKIELTEQDRQALMQLSQHSGYPVFLKLCETKCVLQDVALMSVEPGDEKKILGEHAVAVAKWAFFAEIQQQVAYEVNELFGIQKARVAEAAAKQEEPGEFV